MYYAFVRSVVIDGDLDFRNEFDELTPYREQILENERRVTPTGLISNKYHIGYALLSLPGFLVAHLATLSGNALGILELAPDGYSLLYDFLVPFSHALFALWGFILAVKVLEEYFSTQISLLAMGLVWFGTSLFYYGTVFLTMVHAAGFLLVSALFYLALQFRRDRSLGTMATLGLVAGLAVVLRPTNLIFLLLPGIIIGPTLWDLRRTKPTLLGLIAAFSLPALVVVSLQIVTWQILYGVPIHYSYAGESFFWSAPAFPEVLISSNHGLLFFSPVVALAFLGLIPSRGSGLPYSVSLGALATLSLLCYINAAWHSWWFGHAFGARAFSEAGLFFALGLGSLLERSVRYWRLVLPLLALFVLWTCFLMYLYCYARIPPQGEIPMKKLMQEILDED